MIEPLYEFTDPQQVEEHYRVRQGNICVTPSVIGEFKYKKRSVTTPGMLLRMSQIDTPWSWKNFNDVNAFLICLPTSGAATWSIEGQWRSRKSAFVTDNRLIDGAQYAPSTRIDTLVVSSQLIHADLAALTGAPCHKRLHFNPELTISNNISQCLSHIAEAMKVIGPSHDGRENTIALTYLRQAFTTILLQNIPHSYTDLLRSVPTNVTPGRIKRAIDFIHAHAHEPIRLPQIAASAALSVRALQNGFLRYRGVTPMQYLKNIRLQRTREDLLNDQIIATCEQIASRWGFFNFYRFSQAYFAAYGELPRTTHRKVR
ncbi:transcriptional regulator, AraC family [Candidatus Burkholderia verschuerenii]|uniref:Transcriptional regulator, AraC family n=1 Tax=Candidatus Burkholderia verschuerenii TaxID=242163 RepID=A0A0L0M5W3_9BURK|nr:AraC family transcriptional regulator [Candidatus Burkholderia verschuerenii]KND57384.1 transcriptional regulator, AraC family [Candidatus Burkholderia verschuerenii]